MHFCQFSVLDENKKPISVMKSGKGVIFRIDFNLDQEIILKDIFFQISFLNNLGQQLFVLATRFSDGNFDKVEQGDHVLCNVPFLPLLPGIYKLHLIAKEGYQLLDAVFEAVQLEVIAGDVYASGKLQPVSGGNVIVKHQWEKNFETQLLHGMK